MAALYAAGAEKMGIGAGKEGKGGWEMAEGWDAIEVKIGVTRKKEMSVRAICSIVGEMNARNVEGCRMLDGLRLDVWRRLGIWKESRRQKE